MTTDETLAALTARIERLEALDEIRQLAAKYAVALDMRDIDALVNLFVEDVGVPGKRRGRAALRDWYDAALRRDLLGSAHGVLGHVIDVQDADHATGLVYSRNDLETESCWVIELLAYLDSYRRDGGRWYFVRRTPLFWYRSDIADPPLGRRKLRWPGTAPQEGSFHEAFPSWQEFWAAESGHLDRTVSPQAPPDAWLHTLRRTDEPVRVNPTGRSDPPLEMP